MIARIKTTLIAAALGASLVAATGCTTESFCFNDCGGDGGGAAGTDGGAVDGGGTGGTGFDASDGSGGTGGFVFPDGGKDACVKQNNGVEICDGLDDDCNGKIDDVDLTAVDHCGSCSNNCLTQFGSGVDLTTVTCNAGQCAFGKCSQDYYNIDGDPSNGCEYYCQWNPNGTNTTDPGGVNGCGKDDDCDGQIDEDVNVCADVENCGKCGKKCVIANGTAKCVSTATGSACDSTNTKCQVDQCDPGYYDIDGSAANGCEYQCTPTGPEVCDGVDNDCDGKIDNTDPSLETDDPNVGAACFGGINGECASAAHQGISKCIGGQIKCCDADSNAISSTNPNLPVTGVRNGVCDAPTGPQVLKPGDLQETCNNKDDDCDGIVDNNPIDAGGTCGSSVGNCVAGTKQCQSGALTCVNSTGPQPETCNGQDDNCDGVIDGTLTGAPVSCTSNSDCSGGQVCLVRTGPSDKVCATPTSDAVGDCDVPTPPPAGATSPCQKGTLACLGGSKTCVGSITRPAATPDTCGVDANCDGALTNQPDLKTDVHNCGTCGHDCAAGGGHIAWACVNGACKNNGCDTNYLNCNTSNPDCETYCVKSSNTDQCNGVDDDCNCIVDDVPAAQKPTSVQVCGVATGATDPNCKANVNVSCVNGGWKCTFPAGYCQNAAPNYCAGYPDVCDGLDNNCNGTADENYIFPTKTTGYVGQPCASDDGKPPPGDGACRTTGAYVCASNKTSTVCNATTDLTKASAELCDGIDNDCDGAVDEPKSSPGSNATYYVKPAVTALGGNVYVFSYEASRPDATATTSGSGNGYQTAAPTGTTIDKTVACSVPAVVPWFNVTPVEAAQTCAAQGGRLCKLSDWQNACHAGASCTRGYDKTTSCTTNGTYTGGSPARLCNIGPFDFDPVASGIQDGLLPTASSSLSNCYASWANKVYDIEGNLREITWDNASSGGSCNILDPNGNDNAASTTCLFPLMGGAFNTQSEDGASCDFTFYKVKRSLKLYDTGFRCCFDGNPD